MANSPRPGVWALERSVDHGQVWQTWQYFAGNDAECQKYFNMHADEKIVENDQVICSTEFSKVISYRIFFFPAKSIFLQCWFNFIILLCKKIAKVLFELTYTHVLRSHIVYFFFLFLFKVTFYPSSFQSHSSKAKLSSIYPKRHHYKIISGLAHRRRWNLRQFDCRPPLCQRSSRQRHPPPLDHRHQHPAAADLDQDHVGTFDVSRSRRQDRHAKSKLNF